MLLPVLKLYILTPDKDTLANPCASKVAMDKRTTGGYAFGNT